MNPYQSPEVSDAPEFRPKSPTRDLSLLETFALSVGGLFVVLFGLGVFAFDAWVTVFFFSISGAFVCGAFILFLALVAAGLERLRLWLQKLSARSADQAMSIIESEKIL